MKFTCPICKKVIKSATPTKPQEQNFLPFCSEQCKLIDLGSWLDADYKILSTSNSQEIDQDFDMTTSDSNDV